MNMVVAGHLGMESGGQDRPLLHEYRLTSQPSCHPHAWSDLTDPGRPDEDHLALDPSARVQLQQAGFDETVDLPAIGIPLDNRIEEAEADLGWLIHPARKQDETGAGPEDASPAGVEADQGLIQPPCPHQKEQRRALSPGKDDATEAVQVLRNANLRHIGTRTLQGCAVRGEVALQGHDADSDTGHSGIPQREQLMMPRL